MRRALTVLIAAAALGSSAPADAAIPPIEVCNVNVYCAIVRVAVNLDPPGVAGDGRVWSDDGAVDCTFAGRTGRCEWQYTWPLASASPAVSIHVSPAPNSVAKLQPFFTETLLPDKLYVVDPGFTIKRPTLTILRSGAGTGRVTSSLPGELDCGSACSAAFTYGTALTLTAVPDAGAEFRGWTGACAGAGSTCALTLTEPATTNAVFELKSAASQPQPPTQPQMPQPQPAPDTAVLVEILGYRLSRSVLGFRLVRIELELDERLAATVRLVRGRRTLVSKRVASLGPGGRIVTLVLPRRIAKGRARLQLELRDAAGNARSWSRYVLIGRSGR